MSVPKQVPLVVSTVHVTFVVSDLLLVRSAFGENVVFVEHFEEEGYFICCPNTILH